MKISCHFGLNELNPEFYSGWQGFLAGACNDARDMAVLSARLGFSASAVFNLDCTVARIKTELAQTASTLVAGDIYWFSFSGHGGTVPSEDWSGANQSICLADGELLDRAFRELVAQFKPGVRVLMDIDSCYAGGFSRVVKVIRSRPLQIRSRVIVRPTNTDIPVVAAVLMRTASTADELSADGELNGAYTGSLLAVADDAQQTGFALTWTNWLERVQRRMARDFPAQHPTGQVYGDKINWDTSIMAV